MCHAAGEGDDLAFVKDGHRECEVIEVASRRVGVVRDQDVAGLDAFESVVLDLGFDRFRHTTDKHRQAETDRNRVAVGREQPDREVEGLVDNEIVGRSR